MGQKQYFEAHETIPKVIERLQQEMAQQLRLLLENKHLYQKVKVGVEQILAEADAHIFESTRSVFEAWKAKLPTLPLVPAEQPLPKVESGRPEHPTLTLLLGNVRLFCTKCDGREAFRPVAYTDVTDEVVKRHVREPHIEEPPRGFQLFVLTYQCQACKGAPEAFLISRHVWQFSLDGRSPMEHIDVPPFIPKVERHLFRDAIIAIHGGKTLAALFYLRTFIEQFARRQTGKTGKATGEEIMEAYSAKLPTAQRDEMPSLRHWYDQLSEALHTAREDSDLFQRARAEVEHHFDIRRVFRMPEAGAVETR